MRVMILLPGRESSELFWSWGREHMVDVPVSQIPTMAAYVRPRGHSRI